VKIPRIVESRRDARRGFARASVGARTLGARV
jgi:hypothetical protein